MAENNTGRRNALQLLISTTLSILVSFTGILAQFIWGKIFPFITKIHWTVWIATTLSIYLIISFFVQWKSSPTSVKRKIFHIPLWSDLRAFGEQPAAKLSYWALISIPILVFLINALPEYKIPLSKNLELTFDLSFTIPLNIKLSYFASWFIALALVIFKVACPRDARRPIALDKVRTVNLVLNNVENPKIVIEKENENVPAALDESSLIFRTLCYACYVFGTVAFLVVLVRGGLVVIKG